MASVRQKRINAILQQELSTIFREQARSICQGAMVTVTVVNVSPDMSYAKVYLSIFGGGDREEVFESIKNASGEIRFEIGKRLGKTFRIIPNFDFQIDDSLDYADEIDRLLKDK